PDPRPVRRPVPRARAGVDRYRTGKSVVGLDLHVELGRYGWARRHHLPPLLVARGRGAVLPLLAAARVHASPSAADRPLRDHAPWDTAHSAPARAAVVPAASGLLVDHR